MRLVSFLILSLALHATALVYPVSFAGRGQGQLIIVTISPTEQEGGGTDGSGERGAPARRADPNSHRPGPRIAEPNVQPHSIAASAPRGLSTDSIEPASESSVGLASAITDSSDSVPRPLSNSKGDDGNGSGFGLGGTGSDSSFGSSGAGFGRGTGSGTASGSSGVVSAITQARYRDTPKPDYPDSARREGREGRVLLRVLVDEHGRTKKIEINSSSGSEALDRAATEALRRWRFHPARDGDQALESWLRVPIEFRLADAK